MSYNRRGTNSPRQSRFRIEQNRIETLLKCQKPSSQGTNPLLISFFSRLFQQFLHYTRAPLQLSFREDQIPRFFYLSNLFLKENELISASHLAKIEGIVHQRTFRSNCFHHNFAAIWFSRFPIVFILWIVFFFFLKCFFQKNVATKIVKFVLLTESHSALVNIGVRSAFQDFCPCEKLGSLIRPIVVVVLFCSLLMLLFCFFFFCNSRCRRRLASHDFIFCWSSTSSISTRAALLALS